MTDVVENYIQAWTRADPAAVRRTLAPDAEVEWNLDAAVDDEELLQVLNRIARFADRVTVAARCAGPDGDAAVVYDLAAPFGSARMVEFLAVTGDRISEVRQVYDLVTIDRYFPGLYE